MKCSMAESLRGFAEPNCGDRRGADEPQHAENPDRTQGPDPLEGVRHEEWWGDRPVWRHRHGIARPSVFAGAALEAVKAPVKSGSFIAVASVRAAHDRSERCEEHGVRGPALPARARRRSSFDVRRLTGPPMTLANGDWTDAATGVTAFTSDRTASGHGPRQVLPCACHRCPAGSLRVIVGAAAA